MTPVAWLDWISFIIAFWRAGAAAERLEEIAVDRHALRPGGGWGS